MKRDRLLLIQSIDVLVEDHKHKLSLAFTTLTFLDTLLRLLSFSKGFVLVANVDVGVEVASSFDVVIGLLNQLWARENICLHQTRRLLNSLCSKDSIVHSFSLLQN